MKAVGCGTQYSRLLCDVNRPITSDTLFRTKGDNEIIDLNRCLSAKEIDDRLNNYYLSYYKNLREVSEHIDPKIVVSVHSFSPLYEGQKREVEVGILTSFHEELGHDVKKKIESKKQKKNFNKQNTKKIK
jgi:predicted N-formylglutamate amidohydrolase